MSKRLDQLITALRCLPGVGPKSAQRMAFHLLERASDQALTLADSLKRAITEIGRCETCRTFSETPQCELCTHPRRNEKVLCIVESPADVYAIEHTSTFRGRYFVLMGRLSPLDGIGPKDIGMDMLAERLHKEPIEEIIIATNNTIEGEATAHYIVNLIKNKAIKCTRLASGIPAGGELEYLDQLTLTRALDARVEIAES